MVLLLTLIIFRIHIFQWIFITTPSLYLILFLFVVYKISERFLSNLKKIEHQKIILSFHKMKIKKKIYLSFLI